MCCAPLNAAHLEGRWVWLSFDINFYIDQTPPAPPSVHHCLCHIWCTQGPGWTGFLTQQKLAYCNSWKTNVSFQTNVNLKGQSHDIEKGLKGSMDKYRTFCIPPSYSGWLDKEQHFVNPLGGWVGKTIYNFFKFCTSFHIIEICNAVLHCNFFRINGFWFVHNLLSSFICIRQWWGVMN